MENKEMNPMDGLFRNGMEGQESVPPSASWAQMEALLDAQGPQTKKKKVAIWYWAAAALLPFLMFSLWFFGFNPKQNEMAKSDSDHSDQKRGSGIMKTEKRNEEMANVPSLEKEPIKKPDPKNGADVRAADFKNIASNQSNSIENQNFTNPKPSLDRPENKLPIEMATTLNNSGPIVELPPTEKSKDNDFEIASIEFKPEKKTVFLPEEQVASIEWKKESKTSLSEKIANIKSGQIKNFPTIAEAKESLVAWLSPQR